jgi:hypothetical protein
MHAFAQLRAAMQFGKKIIIPAQPPGGSGVCEGGFVYRMDVVTACGCIGSVLHDEWTQHRMSSVSGRDSEAPGSYLFLPETHQVAELPTVHTLVTSTERAWVGGARAYIIRVSNRSDAQSKAKRTSCRGPAHFQPVHG